MQTKEMFPHISYNTELNEKFNSSEKIQVEKLINSHVWYM